MLEEAPDPRRHPALGGITFWLGCVNLVRLVPELVHFGFVTKPYLGIVALDIVLASVAIASGVAMGYLGRSVWAFSVALWGTLLGNSITLFVTFVRGGFFHRFWNPEVLFHHETAGLLPRLIFYGLEFAVAPYALWSVLTWRSSERPRAWVLTGWMAGGAVVGTAATILILEIPK